MIFYFSGSGGTRWAAQTFGMGEDTVDIGEAMHFGEFSYDLTREKRIAFFLPTYFWGLPQAAVEFMEKMELELPEKYYGFTLMTCGGSTGKAGQALKAKLEERGLHVDAAYSIKMVDNYSVLFRLPPLEKRCQTEEEAAQSLDVIREQVRTRTKGDLDGNKGTMAAATSGLVYPFYRGGQGTKLFAVSDKCVGCRLCASICPDNAIEIREGRPVWVKPSCTQCLACFHHCPQGAISAGRNSLKNGRYLHPNEHRI